MSKIKIKTVKSYKDIPVGDNTYGTNAISDAKTNTIYAIKNKTTQSDIWHEKYHLIKRHPDKPRDYKDFIEQEIDASLYSYKNTGNPKHILMILRGIFNETRTVYPNIRKSNIIKTLSNIISKPYIPIAWKHDFKYLLQEYNIGNKNEKEKRKW